MIYLDHLLSATGGVLRHLTNAGVRSLISQPPTLEELFLRHYRTAENGLASGHPEQQ